MQRGGRQLLSYPQSPGFDSQNHKNKTRTTVSWLMIKPRSDDATGPLDSSGSSLTVSHQPTTVLPTSQETSSSSCPKPRHSAISPLSTPQDLGSLLSYWPN